MVWEDGGSNSASYPMLKKREVWLLSFMWAPCINLLLQVEPWPLAHAVSLYFEMRKGDSFSNVLPQGSDVI